MQHPRIRPSGQASGAAQERAERAARDVQEMKEREKKARTAVEKLTAAAR